MSFFLFRIKGTFEFIVLHKNWFGYVLLVILIFWILVNFNCFYYWISGLKIEYIYIVSNFEIKWCHLIDIIFPICKLWDIFLHLCPLDGEGIPFYVRKETVLCPANYCSICELRVHFAPIQHKFLVILTYVNMFLLS